MPLAAKAKAQIVPRTRGTDTERRDAGDHGGIHFLCLELVPLLVPNSVNMGQTRDKYIHQSLCRARRPHAAPNRDAGARTHMPLGRLLGFGLGLGSGLGVGFGLGLMLELGLTIYLGRAHADK